MGGGLGSYIQWGCRGVDPAYRERGFSILSVNLHCALNSPIDKEAEGPWTPLNVSSKKLFAHSANASKTTISPLSLSLQPVPVASASARPDIKWAKN